MFKRIDVHEFFMLEQKQGQFWNPCSIHKVTKQDLPFSSSFSFTRTISTVTEIFWKNRLLSVEIVLVEENQGENGKFGENSEHFGENLAP